MDVPLLDPVSAYLNNEKSKQVEKHLRAADWFVEALQDMDPNLELHLAKDGAQDSRIVPGYWHVVRRNKGIVDTYMPLTGSKGEFVEPSPIHLMELKRRDLLRRENYEQLKRKDDEDEAKREKEGLEKRAGMTEEMALHLKSSLNPGITFNPDLPWSPKHKARKRA